WRSWLDAREPARASETPASLTRIHSIFRDAAPTVPGKPPGAVLMNLPSLLIGAACTLTVGACSPAGPPAARTALDCPAVEGELTRTAIAPDRRSCTYAARDGGDV